MQQLEPGRTLCTIGNGVQDILLREKKHAIEPLVWEATHVKNNVHRHIVCVGTGLEGNTPWGRDC